MNQCTTQHYILKRQMCTYFIVMHSQIVPTFLSVNCFCFGETCFTVSEVSIAIDYVQTLFEL